MSRRRSGTNEASRVWIALCEGAGFHTLNCWLIPSKTRHLVLRETALVHKEYKDYVEFIHSSGGAGGEQLAPEAHLTAVKHVAPAPRATSGDRINMETQHPKKQNL